MKVDIYFINGETLKVGGVQQSIANRLLNWYYERNEREVFELITPEGAYYFMIPQINFIALPK